MSASGAERRAPPSTEGALEACFEAAAVGLAVASATGAILRANAAFAAMLGMRPEEVVGRSFVDLSHPDDRALTTDRLRAVAARRLAHVDVEKRLLRKDGTAVWTHVTVVPALGADGAAIHQLVTVRDLTERQDLTAQLLDASTRFQRLVDANIVGVAIATNAGVLEANDEFLRLAGTTREAFEAGGIDWQAITAPEHLQRDMRGLEEIIARGACTPFEKEYVRPDGTRVPILVGGALLEREPLRWIAFALDLTERRRAEAERDRILEEARAARDVAAAALGARDALLARVTHDLRAPISANAGYASLMLEGIPEPLPSGLVEYVRRMRANQEHMLALIDELLEFARGASDRVAAGEALDVGTLLDGVESLVAPQARAAGVTYVCPTPDPPLSVRADRVKATQILVNLVSNAVKFTPADGRVTLSATAAGQEVRISVADTGVGIPAAQLGRIFEPFVQGPGAEQPRGVGHGQRGFGLGLAIGRELARGMGGDITVASTPRVGSTFTLVLPAA